MRAVAAKIHEETYRIILYEAASRGVTVSVVVRKALEAVFGPHGGNLDLKRREGIP